MQTQLYDCLVRFLGGLVILELDNYIGSVIKKKVTIIRHRIVGVEYEEQRKTIFLFMAITILVVVLVNLFLRKENEDLLK
jgi:negative regulator of replication initiation